jgi:hypothetical protein
MLVGSAMHVEASALTPEQVCNTSVLETRGMLHAADFTHCYALAAAPPPVARPPCTSIRFTGVAVWMAAPAVKALVARR